MLGDVSLSHCGSCVVSIFFVGVVQGRGYDNVRGRDEDAQGRKDAQASTGDGVRGFIDVLNGEQVVGRRKGVNARFTQGFFMMMKKVWGEEEEGVELIIRYGSTWA